MTLYQALSQQKKSTEPVHRFISGMLGIPLDGERLVEVPNRNAFVYVRLRNNQSEVIQAYNNQVSPAYNLPVLVERMGNRYEVVSVDTQRYENNWASFAPFLPRHGNTHSFDIESGGGGDIVWVYPRQFMPLLVMPSGSAGAANLIVNAYTLKNDDGTWRYVGNTGTQSLNPYIPSSTSGAVMGLVYLDSESGNPQFIINSGTVFSNTITGSSQITPYIPQVTSNTQIPLAAVRLVTGSVLSWDNIYDVRQFVHTESEGGSAGVDTIGIAGMDEGVPVGTGTILNVVGGGATLTRSGTVLNLDVQAGAGGSGLGVMAQDEGVPLGTGTTFNFVGNNVHASISGAVVRVFVTGSSGLTVQDTEGTSVPSVSTIVFTGTATPNVVNEGSGKVLVYITDNGIDIIQPGGATVAGSKDVVFNDSTVVGTGTIAFITHTPKALPEAYGYDYKINASSISGSITVTLTHIDGSTPSSSNPLIFNIAGQRRECNSEQKITIPSGTNWFNAGSSELGGEEVDYFTYAIWSNGFVFGLGRIPWAQRGADIPGASTDEQYIRTTSGISNDDRMDVIGRIRATLSASSRVWTVSSSSSWDIISRPIYETDWLTWRPVPSGFSANPDLVCRYKLIGKMLRLSQDFDAQGTSNSTDYTETAPFRATSAIATYFQYSSCPFVRNNGSLEAAGVVWMESASNVLTFRRSANATWTASGGKVAVFNIAVELGD